MAGARRTSVATAVRAAFDFTSLRAAALLRLHNGAAPSPRSPPSAERPSPHLELFEYEASPWCRRVRETICVLGLKTTVMPCPRETLRCEGAHSDLSAWRPEVQARGGRLLFPYLYDHSAGVALNESEAIVEHLWRTYGDGVERPWQDVLLNGNRTLPRLASFALLASPSGCRPLPSHGLLAAPSRRPDERSPLVLYGNEPDAGSKLAREALCSLMIKYVYVPTAQCETPIPRLEDPTTGATLTGGEAIRDYLNSTYRRGPSNGILAAVPEPNLGDADRASWLTGVLRWLPAPRPGRW